MKKLVGLMLCLLVGYSVVTSMVLNVTDDVSALNINREVASTYEEESTSELENDSELVIVIDAGHGGYDSGGTNFSESVLEKDINLSVALLLGDQLEAQGYTIVYTRDSDDVSWSSDNIEDLQARCDISNQYENALYISIHANQYESSDVSGYEIWADYNDSVSYALASSIDSSLASLNYTYQRGIMDESTSSLYVIEHNNNPSILIELGFLTNDNDVSYMTSSEGQSALAQSIANGIISYLNN